jgi:hypothetical protein
MGKKINAINRLTSASLDFRNCIRFLDELDGQQYGSTLYEALLVTAIIFYSRPFSTNEEKLSTSPSDPRVPKEVLADLTEIELKLHKRLRELRNKAIAHAEWDFHPTGVSEAKIIKAMPFSIWKHFPDTAAIRAFHKLARKVLVGIQNEQANILHVMP